MKKLVAIFFLLVFTLATTAAGELLKLPQLLEHFSEHAERDHISFCDFMKTHYVQGHTDDGDEQQEQQMPFKTLSPNFSVSVFSPAHLVEVPSLNALVVPHVPIPSAYKLSDPLFSIFHPPRLA